MPTSDSEDASFRVSETAASVSVDEPGNDTVIAELLKQGRAAEALALLHAQLCDAPDDPRLLANLSGALFVSGDYEMARDVALRAVACAPARWPAWVHLFTAESRLVRPPEPLVLIEGVRRHGAQADVMRALAPRVHDVDPDTDAATQLARELVSSGHPALARSIIGRRAAPVTADVAAIAVECAYALDDDAELARWAPVLLEHNRGDLQAIRALLELASKHGHDDGAVEMGLFLLERDATPLDQVILAYALARRGRDEDQERLVALRIDAEGGPAAVAERFRRLGVSWDGLRDGVERAGAFLLVEALDARRWTLALATANALAAEHVGSAAPHFLFAVAHAAERFGAPRQALAALLVADALFPGCVDRRDVDRLAGRIDS
jgi:tetratricopeptide (TPR) repeat protein